MLQTTVRRVASVVTVVLQDTGTGQTEVITATLEHPFYVAGKGFIGAGHLSVGSQVVTRYSPILEVKSVTVHQQPGGYNVYNLVVDNDHTYFVGKVDGGAWVHNPGNCPPTFPKTPEELDQVMGFEGVRSGNASDKVTWDAGRVRIRYEEHPLEPGETFNPRHHGPHFHVEVRPNTNVGWNNPSVGKLHPEGYVPGSGTGFVPGEPLP